MVWILSFLGYFLIAASASHDFYKNDSLISGRIIGGSDAKKGELSHQVSIQWGNSTYITKHFCGGSIINNNWILTAGHCLNDKSNYIFVVKAGKYNISAVEDTEQVSVVDKVFVHENYKGATHPFDIGLIKLKVPLKFNKYVSPIKLPKSESIPTGNVTISGWGSVSPKFFKVPDILQKINVPIIDLTKCNNTILKVIKESSLDKTNICSGPLTGGLAPCSADSGGPIIYKNKFDENEIVGIVSWGFLPCGAPEVPSINTRVSAFIGWIYSIIRNN